MHDEIESEKTELIHTIIEEAKGHGFRPHAVIRHHEKILTPSPSAMVAAATKADAWIVSLVLIEPVSRKEISLEYSYDPMEPGEQIHDFDESIEAARLIESPALANAVCI